MDSNKGIKIRNLDVLMPSKKKSRLRWKEYQILSLLVARSPELVSRSEIIENIWKGTYCSDSTINQTIKSIRQKIGDAEHTLIRTIPRLGYKVENKEAFHFITEADGYITQEILLAEKTGNEPVNDELSDGVSENINELAVENPITDETRISEPISSVKSSLIGDEPRNKMARMPFNRVVKYFLAFILLLAISHVSYILGGRTRMVVPHELPNKAQLVLSLSFNNPPGTVRQTLTCRYQENSTKEMHIECVAPSEASPTSQFK